MKASLKFREDQKPLFRAKIPLNLLGFPFQSGIAAGESKELSLSLGTLFQSGPSLRIAYRPNDSWNPFSVVVKTGIGSYGSPESAPMTMSAEFNPLELGNPKFFIHFRPQLGDFSIKKSQSSVFNPKVGLQGGAVSDDDGSVEVVERPGTDHVTSPSHSKMAAASLIGTLFSDMAISARTTLPVRSGSVLRCRWGIRFPTELSDAARVSFQKLPMLVMNKISIEQTKDNTESGPPAIFPGRADLAGACLTSWRQMNIIQAENELLKKAVEGLRSEIAGGAPESPIGATESGKVAEGGRSGFRSAPAKVDRRSSGEKKSEMKKPGEGGTKE